MQTRNNRGPAAQPPQDSTFQERRIVEAAKSLFVLKGFDETSMCDIASAAGVTRPALHYYFRTKERMFHAVFGDIIKSLAPSIEEILLQDTTAIEKLSRFVDIYLEKFIQEPSLPLFIMMEIHRDAAHLVDTASRLDIRQYVSRIASYLTSEMECGHIRKVPLYTIFYTFFGLLTYPFLTRNLFSVLFNGSPDDFESVVRRWKPYVMMHIADMLDAGAKEKEPETAT